MGVTAVSARADELTDDEITHQFGALLQRAVRAFGRDPSYLVDMAEHGSLIAYKRALWEVRTEVTRAEKAAREQCRLDAGECPFTCANEGACGFGECRYAKPEHASVSVGPPTVDDAKVVTRPEGVESAQEEYRLEDTIQVMLVERGVTQPVRLSRGRRRR